MEHLDVAPKTALAFAARQKVTDALLSLPTQCLAAL